jgi:hypothetical protein
VLAARARNQPAVIESAPAVIKISIMDEPWEVVATEGAAGDTPVHFTSRFAAQQQAFHGGGIAVPAVFDAIEYRPDQHD